MRVDLHTHSSASPDGGISAAQYRQLLESNQFTNLAITDHNRVDLALKLQAKLGAGIIVGEEIMTNQGEIIGLFLKQKVEPGQTARATAEAIRAQGGLVYIPHPFETIRKGLQVAALDEIVDLVDLVETRNGRAIWQNRSDQATIWAKRHHKVQVASSDAHVAKGLGYTYTKVNKPLSRENCRQVLAKGQLHAKWPPLSSLLYPKLNRWRKRLKRSDESVS